jgi:hypothetical protein
MPNTEEKGKLIEVLSKHIPYGYGTLCLIADELMAEGVTVQEWISVKKRLPQDDLPFGALCEIVQVLLDDGTVTVGWCNRGLKCWYYMPIQATNFVGHGYDKTPVIAWQPLAQPPKGE